MDQQVALSATGPANAPSTPSAGFQVVLVSPAGYPHSAALTELVETVVHGLRKLGHSVSHALNQLVVPGPRPIIFGAHLLNQSYTHLLPADTIIYNLEQIGPSSSWCSPTYLELLKRFEVWDYSKRNLKALAQLGAAQRSAHVPIGYVPELSRIKPVANEDIDVLFYGSVNARRASVIQQLRDLGLSVCAVFGAYGAERDALIARSRVTLNMHFYDTGIFELVRVSYLLANHKAVVAERNPGTEMDPDMTDAVRAVPYDHLAVACQQLVLDPVARYELAARGFERMSARDERALLSTALALGADH
ncbi:MAG: hypothetical protein ACP5VR_13175 [Acidimicrobiales bacterium]